MSERREHKHDLGGWAPTIEKEGKVKLLQKHCDACGICVGQGYLEPVPSHVGKNTICSDCYGHLHKRGKLEISRRGYTVTYLLPDSNLTQRRLFKDGGLDEVIKEDRDD